MKLDYVTFNFAAMDLDSLSKSIFGGQSMGFSHISRSNALDGRPLNECQCSSPSLGLFWHPNNGFSEHPFTLQVSGVGCSKLAPVLPILRHCCGDHHISRLDFAIDILVSKSEWRSTVRGVIDYCFDQQDAGRKAKLLSYSGNADATTIYCGSRSSPYYFRIYNKSLEASDYQFYDGDQLVEVPSDCYVIRYEIELKRFRRTLRGEKILIDPTPLFDLYYSSDPFDHAQLSDYIMQLWKSYAADFAPVIGDSDLTPVWFSHKTEILFNVPPAESSDALAVVVGSAAYEPFNFDRSVQYVLQHYGKYIPYIVCDSKLYRLCVNSAKVAFTFVPDLLIEDVSHESGYSDFSDPDQDLPFSLYPQTEIDLS